MTTFQVNASKAVWALRRLATLLAIALVTLTITAAVTGILIAYYYQPQAGAAYDSLKVITQDVNYGWLVRRVHDLAGNGLIVLSLLQIVVLFLGERLRRSWLSAWVTGALLAVSAVGLNWTAIILDWSQIGYWRMKVEVGQITSIPLIGPSLADILSGGSIGSLTVAHMYTIHSYLLSALALVLSVGHLVSLLFQEKELRQS